MSSFFPSLEQMSPEDLNTIWSVVRHSIVDILYRRPNEVNFTDIYHAITIMTRHNHAKKVYLATGDIMIENFRKRICPRVVKAVKEDFLSKLNLQWNHNLTNLNQLSELLLFIDRVFVPQVQNLPTIYDLGIKLFRKHVLNNDFIKAHLTDTMLASVTAERQRETSDWLNFKNACMMLITVGLGSRFYYEEVFEVPFLAESALFFGKVSQIFLKDNTASGYIGKVNEYLAAEEERCQRFLDGPTREKLRVILHEQLIAPHMETIVNMDNGVEYMIRNDLVDQLKNLYSLFIRSPNGVMVIVNVLSKYLRKTGELINVADPSLKESAVAQNYAEALISLRSHFKHIMYDAFNNDVNVQNCLQVDFKYIINLDSRAPEYLSLFVDVVMKSKNIDDCLELVTEIDKAIDIFCFLNDKDVFEKFYRQFLSKRLLSGRPVQDAERTFVGMLRTECGSHYTHKLEAMFHDIETSVDMVEKFNEKKRTDAMRKKQEELERLEELEIMKELEAIAKRDEQRELNRQAKLLAKKNRQDAKKASAAVEKNGAAVGVNDSAVETNGVVPENNSVTVEKVVVTDKTNDATTQNDSTAVEKTDSTSENDGVTTEKEGNTTEKSNTGTTTNTSDLKTDDAVTTQTSKNRRRAAKNRNRRAKKAALKKAALAQENAAVTTEAEVKNEENKVKETNVNQDPKKKKPAAKKKTSESKKTEPNTQKKNSAGKKKKCDAKNKKADAQKKESEVEKTESDMQQKNSDAKKKKSNARNKKAAAKQKESEVEKTKSDAAKNDSDVKTTNSDAQTKETDVKSDSDVKTDSDSKTVAVIKTDSVASDDKTAKSDSMKKESEVENKTETEEGLDVKDKESIIEKNLSDNVKENSEVKKEEGNIGKEVAEPQKVESDVELEDMVENEASKDIQFSIKVLTKVFWPVSETTEVTLPCAAERALASFEEFYLTEHQSRRLNVNASLGQADVLAYFRTPNANNPKGYVIEKKLLAVTTYQMIILDRFNYSDECSYDNLLKDTGIPERELKRSLFSISMAKRQQRILIRKPGSRVFGTGDVFVINEEFAQQVGKVYRIRIQNIVPRVDKPGDENGDGGPNKKRDAEHWAKLDRPYEIDVVAVRVMKARKTMYHSELVADIVQLLSKRFIPEPALVKRRIEALIEREFFSRDAEDITLYHYIA